MARIFTHNWQRDAHRGYADPANLDLVPDNEQPECPYCTYPVDELSDGRLICVPCGVTWVDAADIESERATLAAAPFHGN